MKRLIGSALVLLAVAACTASTTATSIITTTTTATSTTPTSRSATPTSTSATTTTTTTTSAAAEPPELVGCDVSAVPPSAGLDPFYAHGCQIDGFWVVANQVVEPAAIERAASMVERIFAADSRLTHRLVDDNIRLGIIGRDQRTTEMPEYRDLNEVFPDTDWDSRARGLGATFERPLVSAGEENILCLPADRYLGEDILLHEFAHVLHQFGYRALDPRFDDELFNAYQQALDRGTWDDTYAATDYFEYWAEGVQSFFARNLTADPADGIHGPIDTRGELERADPALFTLIDDRLGMVELPPPCGP